MWSQDDTGRAAVRDFLQGFPVTGSSDGFDEIFLVRKASVLQLGENQLSIDLDLKGPCAPQTRLYLDARILFLDGTGQLQQ